MKKYLLSALAIAGIGYFSLVGYAHWFDKEQAPKLLASAELPESHKAVAGVMFENGCQYCHTPNAELPGYTKLPLVGQVMAEDIEKGVKFFRLDRLIEGMKDPSKLSEADLAKLEQVIRNDEMPIAKYIHVHWGSRPDDAQKKIILDWITAQRQAHFLPKTEGADATRLVQPIPDQLATDPHKVALGEGLYFDGRLSGDGSIQCHTCHKLAQGGVDNLPVAEGIHGLKGGINAPTVFNAAFNKWQFWDGRAKTLADQAGGPPTNPIEMGSKSWDDILARLSKDEEFMKRFHEIYPTLTQANVTDAIGEYEKTLITPNSAFDRFLKGDQNALTDVQKRGYEHFKNAKCDTCHTGTAMGGQSFEYMGLYGDYFKDRGTELTDADQGRYAVTKDPSDMHRFKVPTLRNVALTAPYMHDASAKDLKEAVRIMGIYQSNKQFSDTELNELVAFLESLTGEYKGKLLTNEKVK
ncbi:cytochrome-c peroxidase [Actinobacillus genomosp. 2]|uniref:cytochrome c peroxidase n=1 Tax=Actinobacillus genomosp. 2 TaxID=230709 RepID=UPI0024415765|nr:cytochrome c peroxidase [Actinobacillus genomosp. 2]WGE31976.1 cytochrome-c peroxidase [Actinobacillus genomosp. 2]